MQASSSGILIFALAAAAASLAVEQTSLPQHVWMEAETFSPLRGSNFSFIQPDKQQAGSWAISGPGVADAWTQGGESEWMSIAARADEASEIVASREIEVPSSATYTLWVRYSDYREKEEGFGVRVKQGERVWEHVFGRKPVIDELDPMKLLWDWSFAWDHAALPLTAGPARIELFTTGPTQARRQVDCLCLTTDTNYRPRGREKPEFAAWMTMRAMQRGGLPAVEQLTANPPTELPTAWKIAEKPPAFVWNVRQQWAEELKKPAGARVEQPFSVDEPLLKDFLAAYREVEPPIYREALSGPTWPIAEYPKVFASGSPFIDWLTKHPDRPFAVLLNYGNPDWPKDADRPAVHANFERFGERFQGYIAGESISHTSYDSAALEAKVRGAKTRAEVLEALREVHTASVVKKFSDYYGAPVTPEEAWTPVVSCLSANMEAFSHALCHWGVKAIGHENTGNSPTLSRRLAFLRGAARQFNRQMVDYQSCNFGDAATMYSRQSFFYPASSRYVLDNSYDVFAGAGMNWLWKDYVLWHLAGVRTFYNEQGVDLFWKPGGNSAGDDWPVQLSPKGKVAEAALRLAREHPRGTQWTPIAFLIDEAHGWAQERFTPGSFGLDPALNPAVLTPGRHEASLRGWFDLAYFPAPETQNEPTSATRQCYVNGIFGDIFDVIVNAPAHAQILSSYPVVIVGGEVAISAEWGKALATYVQSGGTLVVCAGQLSGEGVAALDLPASGETARATAFTWQPSGEAVQAQPFRFQPLSAATERVLATAGDRQPIALLAKRGKGRLITVGIPLGLGIDDRPVPVLALLLRQLAQGLTPVHAVGDVEWVLNRLDDGRWLVALLNNSGVEKPQHGIVPTRHEEERTVKLETTFSVRSSEEWMTHEKVKWRTGEKGATVEVSVPAGAVRLIAIEPAP
jgi:hypothetical protein